MVRGALACGAEGVERAGAVPGCVNQTSSPSSPMSAPSYLLRAHPRVTEGGRTAALR